MSVRYDEERMQRRRQQARQDAAEAWGQPTDEARVLRALAVHVGGKSHEQRSVFVTAVIDYDDLILMERDSRMDRLEFIPLIGELMMSTAFDVRDGSGAVIPKERVTQKDCAHTWERLDAETRVVFTQMVGMSPADAVLYFSIRSLAREAGILPTTDALDRFNEVSNQIRSFCAAERRNPDYQIATGRRYDEARLQTVDARDALERARGSVIRAKSKRRQRFDSPGEVDSSLGAASAARNAARLAVFRERIVTAEMNTNNRLSRSVQQVSLASRLRGVPISSAVGAIGPEPVLNLYGGAVPENCDAPPSALLLGTARWPKDWCVFVDAECLEMQQLRLVAHTAGIATHVRVYDNTGQACLQGTVGLPGSGAHVVLTDLVFQTGDAADYSTSFGRRKG